jgi:DNA-binding response OmpR family regulator
MYKVLVIEDEAIIGDMLSMYLAEEGLQVKRMDTGEKGLKAFQTFAPDIILLDLMLPDMDGLDLCLQLRAVSRVPILVVSMKNKVIERVNALAAGADDFLCKPFSMHELSARVHALLRRAVEYKLPITVPEMAATDELHTEQHESHLEDHTIVLDAESRAMIVHGELVETTFSEFEIMKCFLGHPSKVFSREDLINAVRGFDSFVTDRAIDVHIANLRKKIEVNPKEPKLIRTVWGVGYKYVVSQ